MRRWGVFLIAACIAVPGFGVLGGAAAAIIACGLSGGPWCGVVAAPAGALGGALVGLVVAVFATAARSARRTRCVGRIGERGAAVRSAPGPDAPIIGAADPGQRFTIDRVAGEWVRVVGQPSRRTGWVMATDVLFDEAGPGVPLPGERPGPSRWAVMGSPRGLLAVLLAAMTVVALVGLYREVVEVCFAGSGCYDLGLRARLRVGMVALVIVPMALAAASRLLGIRRAVWDWSLVAATVIGAAGLTVSLVALPLPSAAWGCGLDCGPLQIDASRCLPVAPTDAEEIGASFRVGEVSEVGGGPGHHLLRLDRVEPVGWTAIPVGGRDADGRWVAVSLRLGSSHAGSPSPDEWAALYEDVEAYALFLVREARPGTSRALFRVRDFGDDSLGQVSRLRAADLGIDRHDLATLSECLGYPHPADDDIGVPGFAPEDPAPWLWNPAWRSGLADGIDDSGADGGAMLDSDLDCFSDGEEVGQGTDPNDSLSVPLSAPDAWQMGCLSPATWIGETWAGRVPPDMEHRVGVHSEHCVDPACTRRLVILHPLTWPPPVDHPMEFHVLLVDSGGLVVDAMPLTAGTIGQVPAVCEPWDGGIRAIAMVDPDVQGPAISLMPDAVEGLLLVRMPISTEGCVPAGR